jgi:hypothetical protein
VASDRRALGPAVSSFLQLTLLAPLGVTLLDGLGGELEAWSSERKLSLVLVERAAVTPRAPLSSLEASPLNPMLPADDARFSLKAWPYMLYKASDDGVHWASPHS